MRYFHSDDPEFLRRLTDALLHPDTYRVRVAVGEDNSLMLKINGGVWSAPIASTPDPWRD